MFIIFTVAEYARLHCSDSIWYNYYPETPEHISHNSNSTLNAAHGSYFVCDALFSNSKECCIQLTEKSSDNKLLVYNVLFYLLKCFDNACAIFQNSGECIQAYICNINPENQILFSHSCVNFSVNDETPKKYFIFSSIVSANSLKGSTFTQRFGDNHVSNVNNSHATGMFNANSELIGADVSFCTIYNNTANEGRIFYLTIATNYVKFCNFVNNVVKHTDQFGRSGIIFCTGCDNYLSQLIVKNNDCKYLFYYQSATITIDDSYFENNKISTTANYNANIKLTKSFDNEILQYSSTYQCQQIFYKQKIIINTKNLNMVHKQFGLFDAKQNQLFYIYLQYMF